MPKTFAIPFRKAPSMTRTATRASLIGLLAAGSVLAIVLSGCSTAPGTAPGATATATPAATATTSTTPPQGLPTADVIVKQMVGFIKKASPSAEVSTVAGIKAARDAKGDWWVSGTTVPAEGTKQSPQRIIIRQKSGAWVLFDFGGDLAPGDLPREVQGIL
jgi:hypothetical protein